MPQDFYADAATPPAAAEPKEPAQPKEEASDSQVAELPLAVFGANKPKPGAHCTFEVPQVAEDTAVVKYASEEPEEHEEESHPAQPTQGPPGGGGGMGAMLG